MAEAVQFSGKVNLSAIVLAGGQSSRMGRDKALIQIEGVPLLRRVCEAALQCTDQVYVVTSWAERYQAIVPPGCQFIVEQPITLEAGSHGPLVGFAQGFAHVKTEWVLLLACDLPGLSATTLQQWMQFLPTAQTEIALLPRTNNGWEPLCGFYRSTCLPRLQAAITRGERSFQRWLVNEPVGELPSSDGSALFNCNTSADLHQFLGMINAVSKEPGNEH